MNYLITTAKQSFAICMTIATIACSTSQSIAAEKIWAYVAGDGIKLYSFDLDTGAMERLDDNQGSKPSFLAIHPSGKYLYGAGGELSAFAIDEQSGKLTLLNTVPYQNHGLCHLVVDKTGANVLSAGYGAGTVSVHRINDDGHLGERTAIIKHEGSSVNEQRQKEPHAHSINLDAGNNFAFAADLGIDQMVVYRFDAEKGTLEAAPSASVQPGAGPRHFAFHPNGHFAYVINELDSTVVAFRYDPETGQLETIETETTLPADFEGQNHTAEVVAHPSGRFLYGSNRGHNSIVVYTVDPDSGELTFVETTSTGGKWPRNFRVDPTGKFLLAANQQSDNIYVFNIDQETGKLTPTSHTVEVPRPNCIRFLRPSS